MILVVLATLFVTCLLIANIIAVKLVSIGGWIVPAGVIAYPLTFLFTDVIAELYGRKIASRVVWVGFGASVLMVILVFSGGLLPPASFWGQANRSQPSSWRCTSHPSPKRCAWPAKARSATVPARWRCFGANSTCYLRSAPHPNEDDHASESVPVSHWDGFRMLTPWCLE